MKPTGRQLDAKKRMMFSKGDDFYFLTYNTLLLADALGCDSTDKPFQDHRKAAFLVSFIADPQLTSMALRRRATGRLLPTADRGELAKAYADGSARIHLLTRLVFAFEKKGLVRLQKSKRKQAIDFSLDRDNIPNDYLKNSMFSVEKGNITKLRSLLPQLRKSTLRVLLERLFEENGVEVWHD